MYKHFAKALIRTPIHPLSKMDHLDEGLRDSLFMTGLQLASPELLKEWRRFSSKKPEEQEALLLSIRKYWVRSCMRCTPFGTFAGCSTIDITPEATSLVLGDRQTYKKKTRLDMNYLSALIERLVRSSTIQENMKMYLNNSLYEVPGEYRYAEYTIRNNSRIYNLTSVPKTDYLEAVLNIARNGVTFREVYETLQAVADDAEEDDIKDFMEELLNAQILIPELEPSVTGEDNLAQLISSLIRIDAGNPLIKPLQRVKELIEDPAADVTSCIENIEELLKMVDPDAAVPKNTTQTDLFLSLQQRTIEEGVINEITGQVSDLLLLSRNNENGDLQTFKSAFTRMFEDQEVPLYVALDVDLGVGYGNVNGKTGFGNVLIDDLYPGTNQTSQLIGSSDYINQYVVRKYVEYIKEKQPFIEIKESELNAFRKFTEKFSFPDSMAIMGNLMKKENGSLSKDNFIFDLGNFAGPSAANLLGRFAYADQDIEQLIKDILVEEEKNTPDALYAEVVHLPQARVGNVLLRPNLRRYEIPYVGKSGMPQDSQIPFSDLAVSVRNNKIVLRSIKLNKEIKPRLTTAHNYNFGSLPVYKFLCDLQNENLAACNIWDWGLLRSLNHLPRVCYKNIILRKAEWKIEVTELSDMPADTTDRFHFFQTWRNKREIPQQANLSYGDNQLFLDFSQTTSIDLFLQYLHRNSSITIEEYLFSADNSIVTDTGNQSYASELILPLFMPVKQAAEVHKTAQPGEVHMHIPSRHFPVNSSWLYFKIYCGVESAEKILLNTIWPFIEEKNDHLFEQFFFIRFSDEQGAHLRIRFYNHHAERNLDVFSNFSRIMSNGTLQAFVSNVKLDEYKRELERYTPLLIEDAESLFYNDSIAVLKFLACLHDGEYNRDYRLYFSLRGIDTLFNDFRLSLEQKHKLAEDMSNSFFEESGGSKQLRKQLNDKYRQQQKIIVHFMDETNDDDNNFRAPATILQERSYRNLPVVRDILEKSGGIDELPPSWLPSVVHMFMNRLFISQQRKYELLLYTFLERFYASSLARIKKNNMAERLQR
ncbi:MAG TPA: lantibiotic dehydratase [Chitinophaga sp.]|uniref:lantibiotic dehydratase n=1 Tax=Chitinophaga sp. TaxID=1869181 RepID=UPI002C69C667|nr:lantibiotic dehydratase [Chitinophaga sp.]HVI43848.1 lantibiotic dehydratase [Chitinophaga sp.]